MPLMNTREYLDMRYEALRNDGITLTPSTAGANDLTKWDTTRYKNWQKFLIDNSASITDAQAALSGGNGNTQFRLGSSFHQESTVFPGDKNDRRISAQLNLNHHSTDNKFRS